MNFLRKIRLANYLFGYEYIFKGLFENEFLVFSIEYYKNYAELLNKYNISKEVQNYYADNLDLFTDKKKMKQNFRFLIVLMDIF